MSEQTITWNDLSLNNQNMLRKISEGGRGKTFADEEWLFDNGLIVGKTTHSIVLTELGNSILPPTVPAADAAAGDLKAEVARLREALNEFIRIDDSCLAYSEKGFADFTEGCAYVGRRPTEDALKRAKELLGLVKPPPPEPKPSANPPSSITL